MYTFKGNSSRSNVKRFLTATAKIDPAAVDNFITQQTDGGRMQWGTFVDRAGKPVPFADVAGAVQEKIEALPKEAPNTGRKPSEPNLQNIPISTPEGRRVREAFVSPPIALAKLDPRVSPWGKPAAEPEPVPADEPEEPDPEPPVAPSSALGAFALSQLTAKPAEPAADRPPVQNNRPSQNGVTRPSAGTQCAKVWDLADALTRHLGRTTPLATLLSAAMDSGVNQFTARTQYGCWRKFNGITGRVTR